MKQCDVCGKEIPEDYGNLLCDEHYKLVEEESKRLTEQEKVEKSKDIVEQPYNKNGITDPNYQENPEAEDKEQWAANVALFQRNGVLLWKNSRWMYEHIKNHMLQKTLAHTQYPKFIWRPSVVDVGCGTGVGANILSLEADFVWGIDKNERSVLFAKEWERVKNGIYYSSQLTFDNIDIMKDTREFKKFDIVVSIEVIEHIDDYKGFLSTIIQKFDKRKLGYEGTEYFISTPNRNNKSIHKDRPYNKYHVREWTSEEFHAVLSEFFQNVHLMNAKGVPTEIHTEHTPLLAHCTAAK